MLLYREKLGGSVHLTKVAQLIRNPNSQGDSISLNGIDNFFFLSFAFLSIYGTKSYVLHWSTSA
jgi:hypothetical protein